jgi:phosphoribosylaminoimidazole carboxylase (NCAIR synthetase)
MVRVVFIAPFNMTATARFISAVAELPEVQLALVTQEPSDSLPAELRQRLAAHYRVADALDVQQLAPAVAAVGKQLGGIDRILGTLEQLQVQLGQLRDHFGVDGIGEAVARNFRDKARMKDVLRAAGVPCARHKRLNSAAEGWVFAREVGFPMIVKPPDAAAAKGTFRVTDARSLEEALRALRPSPDHPAVAEEFVTGLERSFETVSIRGRAVWDSSTRYNPAPLHVLENPWIQWTVLLPREVETSDTQAVRPYARAALEALGMRTGISHMEWFRRDRADTGPVAISEVGARPPGRPDHVDQLLRARRRLLSPVGAAGRARGLRPAAPQVRRRRRVLPRAGRRPPQRPPRRPDPRPRAGPEGARPARRRAKLPQVGQPRAESYEGEGYAILRHPDTEVVEKALARLVALVRIELG